VPIDERFTIRDEIRHTVPEHEILLSFVSDSDAETFDKWWMLEGRAAFVKWANEMERARDV